MITVRDFSGVIEVPGDGIRAEGEELAPCCPGVSVLVSEASIRRRISRLAEAICMDFKGDIHGIAILKGSIVFFSDLIREINRCSGRQVIVEVMEVRSYEKTESTGTVTIKKDAGSLEGKDVLIVEDVVDTGLTLSYLKKYLMEDKRAGSVRICCLTDKPSRRKTPICADYTGFVIPDKFIVGYGIDYDEKYRSLPYIGFLDA